MGTNHLSGGDRDADGPGAGEPRQREGCPAACTLSPDRHQYLDTLPGAAHVVNWYESCELEPGHDGPHHSSIQDVDDGPEYWLRWNSQADTPQLVTLPYCPARADDDVCTLFEGHPGAHNLDPAWERVDPRTAGPPAAAGRSYTDYLQHREAAATNLSTSSDPAHVHASLALAAAVNRVADLLSEKPR